MREQNHTKIECLFGYHSKSYWISQKITVSTHPDAQLLQDPSWQPVQICSYCKQEIGCFLYYTLRESVSIKICRKRNREQRNQS